jgi:UDP-glucose 4-epimerase
MGEIGIVGGGGFIGSALARHLIKSFSVKILDIKQVPRDLKGKTEYHYCDVRKYGDVEHGLEDVGLVIHTAIVQIPRINEARSLGYEVNIRGTQNVCRAVNSISSVRGMILAGSWHVVGERELRGVIDEEFGFRPDKVEERARLYALCKIGQETIVRIYGEMSEKIFGVIRMGTVLGKGMPEKTAAAIFMTNGLQGKPITPFKHSSHRPMLYADVNDICEAFEIYSRKTLESKIDEKSDFSRIVNICWPEPITILNLAKIVRDSIIKHSNGKIRPKIEIIDQGRPTLFKPKDRDRIKVDISRAASFLGFKKMIDPRETIERLVKEKLRAVN